MFAGTSQVQFIKVIKVIRFNPLKSLNGDISGGRLFISSKFQDKNIGLQVV